MWLVLDAGDVAVGLRQNNCRLADLHIGLGLQLLQLLDVLPRELGNVQATRIGQVKCHIGVNTVGRFQSCPQLDLVFFTCLLGRESFLLLLNLDDVFEVRRILILDLLLVQRVSIEDFTHGHVLD